MVSVVSAAFLYKWLLLYHAMLLDRVFRRTAWQRQIDMSPISPSARTPQMSHKSHGLTARSQPDLQDQEIPQIALSIRHQGRHLIAWRSHQLLLFYCVPNASVRLPAFIKRWHKPTTAFRCGAWSTIGQQNTHAVCEPFKAHGRMGYRHFTFPKHPLFADVFVPNSNAEPNDCWLLSFDLEPVPASLYQEI